MPPPPTSLCPRRGPRHPLRHLFARAPGFCPTLTPRTAPEGRLPQARPRRATAGGRWPAIEATMSSTWRVSATSWTR
ncbi:hypothetical protein EST54_15540 [Streptomyces sioyaensis]|uniref:Uncharacterized protein n=1 Tax=Streptomyces sioyaensis TaxID=67364 RepID=A0A4Q1QVV1_9ACTN|nr:hypothetical protein EST54_15540 [Streptomyces sioyaensis]